MKRVHERMLLIALLASAAAPAHAQVSIDFPLGLGLRLPTYDRVDGATIPFGPTITIGDERATIEPMVAYRSHLGDVDPKLRTAWRLDSAVSITLTGGRETFSNDRWIRSDLLNSAMAFGTGRDARNYYRGDRGEGRFVIAPWRGEEQRLSVYVGGRFENDWSVGWLAGERRGPYSVLDRNDEINGIQRPNPQIDPGHIASALTGVEGTFHTEAIKLDGSAHLEVAWDAPTGGHFTQLTLHQETNLPTILGQRLEVAGHLVTTSGAVTPRQRYAYLGGSGTLRTIDLLTLGGDRMYFAEAKYVIPIPGVDLPLVGAPFIAPRFATGAANVRQFGVPTQNVGGRIGLGPVRVDYIVNPRTHDHDWDIGFSFAR